MSALQVRHHPPRRYVNDLLLHGTHPADGAKVDIELSDWISQTQSRRDELSEFVRSPLPIGNDAYGEISALILAEDDAQRMMADINTYVVQAQAQAVLAIKTKYPDNSADERKILVKDAIRDIQRLADGIEVTARGISNRRFLTMSSARAGR